MIAVAGVWILFASFVGIGMLASGASGYFIRKSNFLERTIMIIGAVTVWHDITEQRKNVEMLREGKERFP